MNPFEAFRSYSAVRRELPLDRILARRDQAATALAELSGAHRRRKQAAHLGG